MGFPTGPDTFTGSNGTELHTYNSGWTLQTTDVSEIQSNTATMRAAGSESAYKWDGDGAFSADQYAQAKYSTVGHYGGVTVRITGTSTATLNGYIALFDGTAIDLQKITNGTRANLQAGIGTVANGDTVKLEVVGTSIKVYVNGAQIGTTTTDSSFSSGQPGLYFLSNANSLHIDDWTSDTIPSGGGASFVAVRNKPILQAVNRAGTY